MGMQLHQLRYVVSVADERSFTKAAAGLLVAQPSVSAAVRALERELGVELFHRSGGHVTLSPAGEAFLPWARQVLADCDAGVAAVGDLLGLQRGRLSLGATPSITTDLLPPVLADFHRRYPKVDVSLREGGSRRLVDSLERGDIELAVVILPVEKAWVRAEPLVNEQLVRALPTGHPLTGRDRASVHDLAELPLVMFRDGYDLRETTLAMCRRAGFQPPFAVEGLEMDGVLACCAAGVGRQPGRAAADGAVRGVGLPPDHRAGLPRRPGPVAGGQGVRGHPGADPGRPGDLDRPDDPGRPGAAALTGSAAPTAGLSSPEQP